MAQKTFHKQYYARQYEQALETCDMYTKYASDYFHAEHPAIMTIQNNKVMALNKL